MGLSLGIHLGHHASLALVQDGTLIAATQLERITRIKNFVCHGLSKRLEIKNFLESFGFSIEQVDIIVSSFQGTARGGVGFQHSVIEEDFDPYSNNHYVISHHLAHAYCASSYAPKKEICVLVSDLKYRESQIPHPNNFSIIQSVGALYENVSRLIFNKEGQHGSLMALAAYNKRKELIKIFEEEDGEIIYHNNWQQMLYKLPSNNNDKFTLTDETKFYLADSCQNAAENILLHYAKKASELTGLKDIALAGGSFLNILANSKIYNSSFFDSVSLPSAPNDAGISIGCAFWGAVKLKDQVNKVTTDRLGIKYELDIDILNKEHKNFISFKKTNTHEVAKLIFDGKIFARCSGRSEFGPRALGGRSILASPLLDSTKNKLNKIKKRQSWRPVAPIILKEEIGNIFHGPLNSSWMTFSYNISDSNLRKMPALEHPDNTTRCQTLDYEDDPWLYDLITKFKEMTGLGVLVNTSFNGPDEPIIENYNQAIDWYLKKIDVDYLLIDNYLVERNNYFIEAIRDNKYRINNNIFILRKFNDGSHNLNDDLILSLNDISLIIKEEPLKRLFLFNQTLNFNDKLLDNKNSNLHFELYNLLIYKFFWWCFKKYAETKQVEF
ncbi:carbamoyltransferase C-terminal domain-containing protein [Acinetobacter baumannii]|uniref:carbamoyltransferase C-terminal domain-containing protein n=1 Tax=Acinetobacter baumannii TaxID=470 RepID=UPI00124DF5E1|nr:carbamoyltransferase C-terminal domain-containing protein [Acinetobacter baumannii]QFH44025.1 carbamoyltransferase [Acinetobacter baumannii]